MFAQFEVLEDDCIGCGLCKERAPENMEEIEGESLARVFSQPANAEQEEACLEAAEFCPIGALSVVLPPESPSEYPPATAVAAAVSS